MTKRQTIWITGLAHDLAEATAGVALASSALLWGWPPWLAGVLASPLPAILKFGLHRYQSPRIPIDQHLRDGLWECLVFGAGWWVLLGSPWRTLPALVGWWLFLTALRRRALATWANP